MMKDKVSLYWILVLLAALFLGPIIIENAGRTAARDRQSFGSSDRTQELLDAPANKPASSNH